MPVTITMALRDDPDEIRAAVTGLAAVSLVQMQKRHFPLLYASGVRYQREPPGRERWQTAAETLQRQEGDCEDLAAYRLGELWRHGELGARIHVKVVHSNLFHIQIRRQNGQIEDPSRLLGM